MEGADVALLRTVAAGRRHLAHGVDDARRVAAVRTAFRAGLASEAEPDGFVVEQALAAVVHGQPHHVVRPQVGFARHGAAGRALAALVAGADVDAGEAKQVIGHGRLWFAH